MRRLIAIAALALLAACSDTKTPDETNPSSPPASASASASGSPAPQISGVPGGAAKDVVCAAYMKAEGEAGAKFIAILPKAADAMADPSKVPGVLTELKAALGDYEAALATEAGRSADGELRAAIEADLATLRATLKTVDASGNDMEKILNALNSPEFQKLGDRVKTLCGK